MTRTVGLRAVAIFLPVAVAATLGCGLVYLSGQQILRAGANDPQIQLAEDAARALDAGAAPASVLGTGAQEPLDVSTSLAPFVVVFDTAGQVLAADGQLDGRDPIPPPGVLGHARQASPNIVTWQPRPGLRIASATAAWTGGTVLAGRSLREAEARADALLAITGAAWVVLLVGIAISSLVAARLWPTGRGD